jgi:AcrR family transcriptional regulator
VVLMRPSRKSSASRQRKRKPRGKGHERRGEILAAARRMFIAEGYETVTTRKLADRVGLSQTGLYVYFRSKEEILEALCHDTFRQLTDSFRAIVAEGGDAPGLLRRLLEGYIEFALAHPDEYQLTFMAGSSAAKFSHRKDLARPFEQQGVGIQSFLLFRDQVARMIAAGAIGRIDATLAAQIIWSATHGLVALLIARPGYLWTDRAQLVDTMVDTLIRGLQDSRD